MKKKLNRMGVTILTSILIFLASCTKDSVIPSVGAATQSRLDLYRDAVKGILVRPNPTTGPITVEFTEQLAGSYTVQVLDTKGTPLISANGECNVGANSVHLNLTSLGKGNYIVSFHSAEQNQAVEVSVQYP